MMMMISDPRSARPDDIDKHQLVTAQCVMIHCYLEASSVSNRVSSMVILTLL